MNRFPILRFVLAGCLGPAVAAASPGPAPDATAPQMVRAAANRLASATVPFLANHGQIPDRSVAFEARLFAGSLFVTGRAHLVYALPTRRSAAPEAPAPVWAFRESFAGAAPTRPAGTHPSPVHVSWYKGSDPARWRDGVPAWDRLELGEPYAGIRATLRAAGTSVEKWFHVAPGADPAAIEVAVAGVEGMTVDADGRLIFTAADRAVAFSAPRAFQVVDGDERPVPVAYQLRGEDRYGFRLGEYDRNRELVIDPLLSSTFLGGHNPQPPGNYDDDIIHGIAVAGGSVYVAGVTQSPDFPAQLGYDDTLDSAYPDGFITRLSPDLSTVIASTYLGTAGFDRVADLAVDADGTLVAVGQAGYGFPVTPGAYTWNGTTPTGGGFVARFSPDLWTLLASAVPTPSDYPVRVALGNGGVYFGGGTNNPGFPITPGAFMDTCCPAGGFGIREYDAFAGQLSEDLGTLRAMTYLGGNVVSGIAVAPDGSVFLTDGSDTAITGSISRMDADLTTRQAYRSYYPGSTSGSSRTYFNDVAVGNGVVVAAGQTYMNDLPATPGAYDTTCGTDGVCDGVGDLLVPRSDGFIAVYSPDLQDTLALTYLGGSDHESIRALALAPGGDILVVGETTSTDFPVAGEGIDASCGIDGLCDPAGTYDTPQADGFVASLSGDLATLRSGSYLGGSGEDRPLQVVPDDGGRLYVAGYTRSADFPTTAGAFDETYNGGTSDAFVSRIERAPGGPGGGNEPPVADGGDDRVVRPRQMVLLRAESSTDPDGRIVAYRWTQVSGKDVRLARTDMPTAGFIAPNVSRNGERLLVFELRVTDDDGATATDRVRIGVARR